MANGVVTQEAVERMAADINAFASPAEPELIGVFMGVDDWEQVIVALRENHDDFIADTIEDVVVNEAS